MESGPLIVDQSPIPTWKLVSVSSIAAGVQFAWALQISLLIPYIQTLGVPHALSSLIWLFTAFSGMILQPLLGYKSDRSTSPFGRRRPFIAGGAALTCLAFTLIGFARDIGFKAGDSPIRSVKPIALLVFLVGFLLLDVSINTLQSSCRALLADLCLQDYVSMRTAMSWFAFFMAVGNVLGYTAGGFAQLHLFFPFTNTDACDDNCANLKSCFIIALLIIIIVTLIAISAVDEVPLREEVVMGVSKHFNNIKTSSVMKHMVSVLYNMKGPMKMVMVVTFLSWLAWFPFVLFGTDWVGREVFGGKVNGDGIDLSRYQLGVRSGSMGLMVNSIVVALVSLVIGPAIRLLGGMRNLWGVANLVLAGGLIGMVVITKKAGEWWGDRPAADEATLFPPFDILGATWFVYLVLGISLAATYSLPFAMATIYSSINGDGQGLSLGVLNLAIVIPQMIVSIGCGPLDKVFGGSNSPSYMLGAMAATISAIVAIFVLPDPLEQAALRSTVRGR